MAHCLRSSLEKRQNGRGKDPAGKQSTRNDCAKKNHDPEGRRHGELSRPEQEEGVSDAGLAAFREPRAKAQPAIVARGQIETRFLHAERERTRDTKDVKEEHHEPLAREVGFGDREAEHHRTVSRHVEHNVEVAAEGTCLTCLSGMNSVSAVGESRQPPENDREHIPFDGDGGARKQSHSKTNCRDMVRSEPPSAIEGEERRHEARQNRSESVVDHTVILLFARTAAISIMPGPNLSPVEVFGRLSYPG